jgi:hypothetical protein
MGGKVMKVIAMTVLLGLLTTAEVGAEISVTLADDRVLEAVDVRRDAGLYLIEREPGRVIAMPVNLVVEVSSEPAARKTFGGEGILTPAQRAWVDLRSGLTYGDVPRTLAGEREPAPAMEAAEPRWVAGDPLKIPKTAEMLEALGSPSRFAKGPVDPHWSPRSDWDLSDQQSSNSWSPARWSPGWNDPGYAPLSDWNLDPRAGNSWAPSNFYRGLADRRWDPVE